MQTLADQHEWILWDLSTGGFGAIKATATRSARPVTAQRWLTEDERKNLKRGTIDLQAYEEEASAERGAIDDED